MDVNKNSYTIVFSIILIVVVAGLLAFVSETLKPLQKENERVEKMQNILESVGVQSSADEAGDMFDKYIVDQLLLNHKGVPIEINEITPFDLDVVQQSRAVDVEDRVYPLFIYENDGDKKYIIPLAGKGLWGPIWGYVSFQKDMSTIAGASFDHSGETPGLGAEINTPAFQNKFIDKMIFDDNEEFVSVIVRKGGTDVKGKIHEVDGISGGTITSRGVSDMLKNTLEVYIPYFKGDTSNAL